MMTWSHSASVDIGETPVVQVGPEPVRIRVTAPKTGISHLRVPCGTLSLWGLSDGSTVTVRIGSVIETRAKVFGIDDTMESKGAEFTPGQRIRRLVPMGSHTWALYEPDMCVVRIGPVIGILTSSTKVMFGPQSGTFSDLMRVGRMKGALVYAFTPAGIPWGQGIVAGYTHQGVRGKGGRWVKRTFPFPDVIYNRLPTRADERNPLSLSTLKRLGAHPGITVFNARFLDKWEVTKRLWGNEALLDRMPDTALWKGASTLSRMLSKHGKAFLKPVSNSLGNGAIRIRRTQRGYAWEMNIPGRGTRRRMFPTITPMLALTSRMVSRHPYLVQDCVEMALYHGCPFDIRALVQKDDKGVWGVTGMAARVAQRNRITTHIPNGGRARPVADTLRVAFEGTGIDSDHVVEELMSTAVMAAEAVDATGGYGEVSLDIGIDRQGCIRIFEVNAKPFRFDEEGIRQVALRRVIGYSMHCAGFTTVCHV